MKTMHFCLKKNYDTGNTKQQRRLTVLLRQDQRAGGTSVLCKQLAVLSAARHEATVFIFVSEDNHYFQKVCIMAAVLRHMGTHTTLGNRSKDFNVHIK